MKRTEYWCAKVQIYFGLLLKEQPIAIDNNKLEQQNEVFLIISIVTLTGLIFISLRVHE